MFFQSWEKWLQPLKESCGKAQVPDIFSLLFYSQFNLAVFLRPESFICCMQKHLKLVPSNPHLLLIGRFWDRGDGGLQVFWEQQNDWGGQWHFAGALVIIRSAGFAHSSNSRHTLKMPVCHKELFCSWRHPCKCTYVYFLRRTALLDRDPAVTVLPHFCFSLLFSISLAGLGAALPRCGAAEGQPWPQPHGSDVSGEKEPRLAPAGCWN